MSTPAKTLSTNDNPQNQFLVTGIGASAGGIQALQEFFKNTSPDSGIAYVVILHLSPDHDSMLAEILQLVTRIPVMQVKENIELQPDRVYVVPPNKSLTIDKNMIRVSPVQSVEERRAPVDIFFRSLAESFGSRAVGIILSGTGANGSMGIKRLKENGGIILVQSPYEAQYSEMPLNSIETGLVDAVLPVSELPAKLLAFQTRAISQLSTNGSKATVDFPRENMRDIFTQLRVRTGHDFSNYKRATMLRRIQRRMNVRNVPTLADYAIVVSTDADEAPALLRDLLISVTNFFRDTEAFHYVEEVLIPKILEGKTSEHTVRIWVAGCATGEEAYSLAILFSERLSGMPDSPSVKIFASDIDDNALSIARAGLYTLNDAADVPPDHLRNYFVKEGDEFRIRRELREMILFANHNIIKDPPFSNIDLISCRNLLIYLNSSAQNRVMETFHFALRPGGHLFIGSSESVDGNNELYFALSKQHNVFQSQPSATRSFPNNDRLPSFGVSTYQGDQGMTSKKSFTERQSWNELHQRLLEKYAPPSLVVNQDFDILHLSDKVGRYLAVTGGEPSNNLLKLIRPELRIELRSGLYQAIHQQSNIELNGLPLLPESGGGIVNIHIRPVLPQQESAQGFLLVVFEDTNNASPRIHAGEITSGSIAEHLEEELVRSKFQLKDSREQYEVQTEELKASNEELQASNEELRSAAEELETSKEELQSINEDMVTVNQELKVKIDELSQTNNDFHNLINSTDIGTVFLDREFRVKLSTPSVRDVFNLIPSDIGRPLTDISGKLIDVDIMTDAENVMNRLVRIEREVETTDQQYYMMRILPYRTSEDHINGVVITFVNITRLKKAELRNKKTEQTQRFLLELGDTLSIMTDKEQLVEFTLKSLGQQLPVAKAIYAEFPNDHQKPVFIHTWLRENEPGGNSGDGGFEELMNRMRGKKQPVHQEDLYLAMENGSNASGTLIPLRSEGEIRACFILAPNNDQALSDDDVNLAKEVTSRTWSVLQRIALEKTRQRSEEHLRIVMESIADHALITTDVRGLINGWNQGAEKLFGYTIEEIRGQHFEVLFTPEDRANGIPIREMNIAFKYGRAEDERWHVRKDKSRFFLSGVTNRLQLGMEGLVKIARDATSSKLIEQQKDQFIGIASHELKTPVTSIKAYAEVLREIFIEAGDNYSADLMTKLDSQVDRLATLISHLLDTTRIAEGQLTFQPEPFDLNDLIRDRIEELQPLSSRHTLILRPDSSGTVIADRERVGQVLVNLIANSIKYSPEGGDIIVRTEALAEGIKVAVQDYGIGMDADSLEKIFERFFRTSNPAIQTYPGLGLGLYITAEIIKRHGGKIWAESKAGYGSTFYFIIPYEYQNEQEQNYHNSGG